MKRIVHSILLALLGVLGGLTPAHAGFDIFLQMTGVTGESTDVNHKNWIEVVAFSHGLSNPGAANSGGAGGGGASKVSHADFVLSKYLDKSSLPLNLKVNLGSHIDTATIEFQTTGANRLVFYRVTLSDVVITSVKINGAAGDDRVQDGLSLAYKKIAWEYWPIDTNGKLGPVVRSEWDVSTNTGK